MSSYEVTDTTHVTDSRPYIVLVRIQDENGRHVQGVGASYLTRGRATKKARSGAESLADETDCNVEVKNVYHGDVKVDLRHFQDGSFDYHWVDGYRNPFLAIPPFKINVTAAANGQTLDGTKSAFFGLGNAYEKAVKNASKQLA